MHVKLMSYGLKHGEPKHSDCPVTMTATRLANPWNVARLKQLDGRDPRVQRFIEESSAYPIVMAELRRLIKAADGSRVGVACFGGRHRSVAIVELMRNELKAEGHTVTIQHRDLGLPKQQDD